MPWRVGANRTPPPLAAASAKEGGKEVWIQTRAQEVMTTAVESGLSTFLFQAGDDDDLVLAWKELARIRAVVRTAARLADESGALLGAVATIRSADDLKEAQAGAEGLEGRLLVEFEGDSWKVRPPPLPKVKKHGSLGPRPISSHAMQAGRTGAHPSSHKAAALVPTRPSIAPPKAPARH